MFFYLDTETTGLMGGYSKDEIVELCIYDENGNVLLNKLVKPTIKISWEHAQRIHGISPYDVANAPTLESLMPEIVQAIAGKTVVIYNAGFDVKFFPAGTFNNSMFECCMLRFAEKIGDWNNYRNSYRWHKLGTAAAHVGHVWTGEANGTIRRRECNN